MTLLILAAGMGSRYGGTKQFDGVGPNNEYLLEFTIYDAVEVGYKRIVIITRTELVDEVTEYFKSKLPSSIEFVCVAQDLADVPTGFDFSFERTKPWGTAHAVLCAKEVIDGKFAIVNADDLYGRNAIKAALDCVNDHRESNQFGLVGYKLNNTLSEFGTVSRGVCYAENGLLTKVTEFTKLEQQDNDILDHETGEQFSGAELVSMNLWVLDEMVFDVIEKSFHTHFNKQENQERGELYIPSVVQELIDTNSVNVHMYESNSEWYGITYKEDKEHLMKALAGLTANNEYPAPLWV